jgi:hypothetical protein
MQGSSYCVVHVDSKQGDHTTPLIICASQGCFKENVMTQRSSHDQKEVEASSSGLDRRTLVPAIILLTLPAAVPLFFLGQAEGTGNQMVLVGTTVCVGLLNVMLIVVLIKWFKGLKT